ncbi:hypothetical protein ATANTOWER_032178 [Ataeniobius toweri]|uniref:Uncharacterized protein n=1 Tax=Ataeniobius toweri TaxID=208326 RepID=A0ABU7AI49_9TELE|nr:hypothetical protein [Ataeniobius toweri]
MTVGRKHVEEKIKLDTKLEPELVQNPELNLTENLWCPLKTTVDKRCSPSLRHLENSCQRADRNLAFKSSAASTNYHFKGYSSLIQCISPSDLLVLQHDLPGHWSQ